jgi:hypothetical protein
MTLHCSKPQGQQQALDAAAAISLTDGIGGRPPASDGTDRCSPYRAAFPDLIFCEVSHSEH